MTYIKRSMTVILILSALMVLAACNTEAPEPAEQDAAASGQRSFIVKEKFEQDGRTFVAVRDRPGEEGHLIQVEVRERALWDAIKKDGVITFDKKWNVTEIDRMGIDEILRRDAR